MTKGRTPKAKMPAAAPIKKAAPAKKPAAGKVVSATTAKLATKEVTSIAEYTGIVADLPEQMWFRGHGMSDSYSLLPSLYRKRQSLNGEQLFELEFQMISRFRERSTPFVGNKFINTQAYDDLSILFYMQHYGVPTRLLDWTENPFVGLYFALNDANNYDFKTGKYKENACVWMMNPVLWNNSAVICEPPMGLISVPNADPVNGYMPKTENTSRISRHRPLDPIAITGFHNSPRIIAQRGVFILYGAGNKSMLDFYESGEYKQDCLIKIEIDKECIGSMRSSLYKMGIADSVVYPDMQGFSAELAKHFAL